MSPAPGVRRSLRTILLLLPAVAGCTAMGAWVYDDPSFALRTVTVRRGPATGPDAGAADSLELLFLGCNRNDYDLLGEGFRARLLVSGHAVAEGAREQPVFLGTRDTSSFVVVVPLGPSELGTPDVILPFQLDAASLIHTPIGNRSVSFRVQGRVDSRGETTRWVAQNGPACRPGLSRLPFIFTRRAGSGEDEDTLPRRPAYPTDPNPPVLPGRPGQPGQPDPAGRP